MDALDTSVSVPALSVRHSEHERCRLASEEAFIPAHSLVETFSAITRMPAPYGIDRRVARQVLDDRFPASKVLVAPVALQRSIVGLLDDAGISGGATYDGLIGLTAAHHGATLLTRDGRAVRTYEALGVAYRLV